MTIEECRIRNVDAGLMNTRRDFVRNLSAFAFTAPLMAETPIVKNKICFFTKHLIGLGYDDIAGLGAEMGSLLAQPSLLVPTTSSTGPLIVLKPRGLAGEILPGLDDDVGVTFGQSLNRGRTYMTSGSALDSGGLRLQVLLIALMGG